MEIIATTPPPQHADIVRRIAEHPYVDALRFNVGARSTVLPLPTLARLMDLCGGKPLWIDLKGRQLRITRWADLAHEPITLNHRISVDLPATIILRNGTSEGTQLPIKTIDGHKVYVDIRPHERFVVGAGQSVNVHGSGLRIEGYLTGEDKAYISAAKALGLKNFMLSFVERLSDLHSIREFVPDADLVLKIESPKGLKFIDAHAHDTRLEDTHLMVARDDLYTNLPDPSDIIRATRSIIDMDSRAIVASRILTSLLNSAQPSLGDISDLTLLEEARCHRIMLCDDLCQSSAFYPAMHYLTRRYHQ